MASQSVSATKGVITREVVASLRSLNRCALFVHDEAPLRAALRRTIAAGTSVAPSLDTSELLILIDIASHHTVESLAVTDAVRRICRGIPRLTTNEICAAATGMLRMSARCESARRAFDVDMVLNAIARNGHQCGDQSLLTLVSSSQHYPAIAGRLAVVVESLPNMRKPSFCSDLLQVLAKTLEKAERFAPATMSDLQQAWRPLVSMALSGLENASAINVSRVESSIARLADTGLCEPDALRKLLQEHKERVPSADTEAGGAEAQQARLDAISAVKSCLKMMDSSRGSERHRMRSQRSSTASPTSCKMLAVDVALRGDEESMLSDQIAFALRKMAHLPAADLSLVLDRFAALRVDFPPLMDGILRILLRRDAEWRPQALAFSLVLLRLRDLARYNLRKAYDFSADVPERHMSNEELACIEAGIPLREVTRRLSAAISEAFETGEVSGMWPQFITQTRTTRWCLCAAADLQLHGEENAKLASTVSAKLAKHTFTEESVRSGTSSNLVDMFGLIACLSLPSAVEVIDLALSIRDDLAEAAARARYPPEQSIKLVRVLARCQTSSPIRVQLMRTCLKSLQGAGEGQMILATRNENPADVFELLPGEAPNPPRLQCRELMIFATRIFESQCHENPPGPESVVFLERLCQLKLPLSDEVSNVANLILAADGETTADPVVVARNAGRILYAFACLGRIPRNVEAVCVARVRLAAPHLSLVDVIRCLYALRVLGSKVHPTLSSALLDRAVECATASPSPRTLASLVSEVRLLCQRSGGMAAHRVPRENKIALATACVDALQHVSLTDDPTTFGNVLAGIGAIVAEDFDASSSLDLREAVCQQFARCAPAADECAVDSVLGTSVRSAVAAFPLPLKCSLLLAVDQLVNAGGTFSIVSDAPAASASEDAAAPSAPRDISDAAREGAIAAQHLLADLAGQQAGNLPAMRAVDIVCALARTGYSFSGDVSDAQVRVSLNDPLLRHVRVHASQWIENGAITDRFRASGLLRVLSMRSAELGTKRSSTRVEPVADDGPGIEPTENLGDLPLAPVVTSQDVKRPRGRPKSTVSKKASPEAKRPKTAKVPAAKGAPASASKKSTSKRKQRAK